MTRQDVLFQSVTAIEDRYIEEAAHPLAPVRPAAPVWRRWVAAAAAVALAVGLTAWGVTRRPQAPAVLPSEDTTAAVSTPLPSQTASLPAVPVPASDASASEPSQTASPAPSTTPVPSTTPAPSVTSVPAPVSEPVSEPVGGSVSTSPSEPDGASAPSAVSGTPDPVSSAPAVTPPVQFSPPPVQTEFTHSESTAKALAAWVMSDAALTEKNGAFREAVEFYRSLGKLPLIGLQQNSLPVRWYTLRSTGELVIWFPENASNDPQFIMIAPFRDDLPNRHVIRGIQQFFQTGETFFKVYDRSWKPSVCFADAGFIPGETTLATLPDGDLLLYAVNKLDTITIDQHIQDVIYRLQVYPVNNEFHYSRDCYWEQNGFLVHIKFTPSTDPDTAIGTEMLSNWVFRDLNVK